MDTNKKEHSMQNNHHSDPTAQLQGLEDFVRSVMQEWRVRGVALAVVKKKGLSQFLAIPERNVYGCWLPG